jgi:hypothetical protein
MRAVRLAGVIAAVVIATPAAQAGVLLGVHGNAARFAAQTGQQSQIRHTFMQYGNSASLRKIVSTMGPVPMLALNATADTPRSIAEGATDSFLVQLNAVVNSWSGPRFYVRPFPEMNAYWVASSAYNQNGTRRDAAYSTRWNRKAFARIALLLRGGTRQTMNATLGRLGLPPVSVDLPVTTPKLRMVWNPQGFGAPDVAGNSAQAYYPGDAYVDVVGDDLYDIRGHGATWAAAQRLYTAHPSKAFAFPEWGVWGFDDPAYVRAMAKFVRQHGRMEFIAYYSGMAGSVFDLATKPASRAAYRTFITPLGISP